MSSDQTVGGTRRKDGSVRPTFRVKPGFIPQELQKKYVNPRRRADTDDLVTQLAGLSVSRRPGVKDPRGQPAEGPDVLPITERKVQPEAREVPEAAKVQFKAQSQEQSADQPPGQSADEPGQSADEPGQSADEPGQSADEPGQSADEPTDQSADKSKNQLTESTDQLKSHPKKQLTNQSIDLKGQHLVKAGQNQPRYIPPHLRK